MTDLQIQGNKIALLDSSNNIVYTLPDSAGSAGEAIITDGAGKLFYGGINIDAVLAAGDSSSRNLTIGGIITANIVEAGAIINRDDDVFQGTSFGYTTGGYIGPAGNSNVIDKFAFSSNANASDVGDITESKKRVTGQSSPTHGYTSGGEITPTTITNTIDKFPFSSDTNASDVGDLTQVNGAIRGAGQSSLTNGYYTGGHIPPSTYNDIQKFPFSSDTNASDVGDLTVARFGLTGNSSTTHGYAAGGRQPSPAPPPTFFNTIDKFPFSSDANATDVGDLTATRTDISGQSSSNHGYISSENEIQKYPFATDANATNIGSLSLARMLAAGQSSASSGYTSGGFSWLAPPALALATNIIDVFSFASDGDATDVGDLFENRHSVAGQQV